MRREPGPFGALLRKHRAAAGYSQEELAERAGVSRRGIADLERGARRLPHPATVRRLADALDLSPNERAALHYAAVSNRQLPDAANDSNSAGPVSTHELMNNLPAQISSFIGREQELAEITLLLTTTRLLTLTGAGGVGKTRLALRVAAEAAPRYRDGVWLVDLAPLADATLVPKAVALALDVQEQPGRPLIDALTDRLRRRELLLVVDNCEHLVQACAELLDALMRSCPQLSVLATSREVLRVAGEHLFRVPSLQVPEPSLSASAELAGQAEAVQLLIDRARSVRPDFSLNNQNASAVVQVCRQLDGIPLALELAAARLSALSVEQLAARLDNRFKLLTSGSATALPRHRTLYGTLEWSHDLLSEPERVLLRRLSVFAGGWILEAAEAVCSGGDLQSDQILDLLSGLLAKSLVLLVGDQPAERVRYRFLETVRQYGWEKLGEADEQSVFCQRHVDWCVALAEEAEPHLYRDEQVRWLDLLEREHGNLRVALAWSHNHLDGGAALGRLVKALFWFWYLRGYLTEGQPWLEPAVCAIESTGVRAGALLTLAWLAYGRGELEYGTNLSEQSLRCARASGDVRTEVVALTSFSFTLRDRGDHARSEPLLTQSLALAREIGYRWGEAFSLYLLNQEAGHRGDLDAVAEYCALGLPIFRELGERLGLAYTLKDLSRVAFERGEYQHASELEQESLVLSRELGNRRGICFALTGLARDARRRGEYRRAGELLGEALSIWNELGNRVHIGVTMTAIASLAAAQRQFASAARLFGAAEAALESVGAARSRGEMKVETGYDEAVVRVRTALGERAFAAEWAAGRSQAADDAIEAALSMTAHDPQRTTHRVPAGDGRLAELSAREREVAVLIAQGYSNRYIAAALVIAPRTADTHVNHILTKLGVHTRAQIAAWVVEHGLTASRPN